MDSVLEQPGAIGREQATYDFDRLHVEHVAKSLVWMQTIFLGLILLGFGAGFLMIASNVDEEAVFGLIGLACIIPMIFFYVMVYRCAAGIGRSGVLWVLFCILFRGLIPMIILSYLTRKWVEERGVRLKMLGLGYDMPN